MGKMVSLSFLSCYDPIHFIRAGNKDLHKIWKEFKFRPDRTTDYGVSCTWASKKFLKDLYWENGGSFIFDRIIIKVAGNQHRHKSLVEFDFGPNQTTHFGVTCPWVTNISHFWTLIFLKPVGQSWSNFMCSIIGVGVGAGGGGAGCIRFWGRLDQNSGFHDNRKPPLTYNGENDVSTFSRFFFFFLSDPLYTCR